MANQRRYSEAEVEEILDLAVKGPPLRRPTLHGDDGPTLRELQEIALEAGIHPEAVADAASAVESRHELVPRQTFLGMPVSVGRVVELPRALTDREWEIVVADLRDTFAAPGHVGTQGGAREWANGNLRVLLEPTDNGHRLRFSTLNRRLRFLGSVGFVELVIGLVFLAILVPAFLTSGGLSWAALVRLIPSAIVAGAGVMFLGWAGLRLPKWALERELQMEQITGRVRTLIGRTTPGESGL